MFSLPLFLPLKENVMFTTIEPAYGVDYRTAKAAKEAWKSGKDFQINSMLHPYDGKYVNIEDAKGTSERFQIRFDQQRKVCNV